MCAESQTLSDTLPHQNWPDLARYMMSRALVHGRRRAEEVREVVRTVEEAGLVSFQSPATAQRQDWAADRGLELAPEVLATKDLVTLLDAVLAKAVR